MVWEREIYGGGLRLRVGKSLRHSRRFGKAQRTRWSHPFLLMPPAPHAQVETATTGPLGGAWCPPHRKESCSSNSRAPPDQASNQTELWYFSDRMTGMKLAGSLSAYNAPPLHGGSSVLVFL